MAEGALVSVVIPARNAEATLARTLESLLAQTDPRWEALLVNDGSTDGTEEIMAGHSARDSRFRLVAGVGEGVAAARNRGLADALGRWLLFLDSDDWIDPAFIGRMTSALDAAPDAQLAYCAYQRVMPDGSKALPRIEPRLAQEPYEIMARTCGAAVHAILVDRKLVQSLGGFDTGLVTCEDWDLWQRVARTGARWVMVDEPLAFYRTTAGSLSARRDDMLRDARTVIDRGFGRDDRMEQCAPELRDGVQHPDWGSADRAWALFALWVVTADAVQGGPCDLPKHCVAELSLGHDAAEGLAAIILDAAVVGLRKVVSELAAHWPLFGQQLHALVGGIADLRRDPEGGRRLLYLLEQQILDHDRLDQPRTLGLTHGLRVSLGRPAAMNLPDGVDRVHAWLMAGRHVHAVARFGALGSISSRHWVEIAFQMLGFRKVMAALPRRRWPVLAVHSVAHLARKSLRHPSWLVRPSGWKGVAQESRRRARLSMESNSAGTPMHAAVLGEITRDEADRHLADALLLPSSAIAGPPSVEAGDRQDRSVFWESLFEVEDPWNYGSAYEQEKYLWQLRLLPSKPVGNALELACAEGHFTSHLAPKVKNLIATDISATALERARARNSNRTNISYQVLDLSTGQIPGGQDLIVCSEVLYYLRDETELREVAGKIANALVTEGHLLTAHAYVLKDDLSRTGFDWDNPFGVSTISRVFSETPGLVRVRTLETDLYRIDLFRRASDGSPLVPAVEEKATIEADLLPEVARHIVWGGAVVRRQDVAHERRQRMPVLMYHAVSTDGPEALARWRVSPDMFAAQMRWLRANGYHSVGSAELEWYVRTQHPFCGRPVMISADDGLRSFSDQAWPIIRGHDMTAELFIVTGLIGKAAEWDSDAGPPAELMDSHRIAALAQEGARFGSHLASHRAADGLSTIELARELVASRMSLKTLLGHDPKSLAAPFSIWDQRLAMLAAECGYTTCFGNKQGPAALRSDLMNLPRIEVMGDWTLPDFIQAMEAVL